ncbi:unnamed protein product, partial [Dovyalis caffra]
NGSSSGGGRSRFHIGARMFIEKTSRLLQLQFIIRECKDLVHPGTIILDTVREGNRVADSLADWA